MFSLRMSFAFGRPSCRRALRCVGPPNLRTCLAFALRTCVGAPNLCCVCVALGRPTCLPPSVALDLRWDVPCVAFVLCCVGVPNLRTCLVLRLGAHLADVPCVCVANLRLGAHLVDVPCVVLGRPTCRRALRLRCGPALGRPTCVTFALRWTFSLRMSFAFGRPSCGRALRCVAVPNLRTCGCALHFRCGCALGHPTCESALRCVGAPNLRTCLVMRLGAHLADVPSVALGCPNLVRPY
jgi:hypothetical protein